MMENEIAEKLQEFESMKEQYALLQEEAKRNNAAADILTGLIKNGDAFLHEDGSVSVLNGSPSKKKI